MPHSTELGRPECAAADCDLGASVEIDGEHYCGTHGKMEYEKQDKDEYE